MPFVSEFYGIIIRMFFNEHLPPHFHAEYQGSEGEFDFFGNQIKGNIKSKNTLRLIKDWSIEKQKELEANWKNIELKNGNIEKIDPLR